MATILVKGRPVFLADEIVKEGEDVIRMALAASFPDAPTMDFKIVGDCSAPAQVTDRAPAVITSHSVATTKG